tara:strand:- start:28397 stop:28597 length:201 start_codon:yes stop_codon:yes gene_type:complete
MAAHGGRSGLLKWNAKPRIVGPWCGDPTSVTGTLWQPSTSDISVLRNSSQIAVPAGGPAMRGGLRP